MEREAAIMRKRPDKKIMGNGSLAKELSKRTGITLLICLLVIGAVLLVIVANSVKGLLDTSFTQLTETNASKIHEKIHSAQNEGELIGGYVEENYSDIVAKSNIAGGPSEVIEGAALNAGAKELEYSLIRLVPNTIKNNSMIEGMGVFFVQNAVDPNVEKYGLYVAKKEGSESDLETVFTDVVWEREYFLKTVETGKPFVSEPYQDARGKHIVTMTTPIVASGKTIGIVLSDIRIDEINKIEFQQGNNPTFVLALMNQDDQIMFHSKDKEAVGSEFTKRLSRQKDVDLVNSKKEIGEDFRVSMPSSKKVGMQAFFSPIDIDGQTWWVYSAVTTMDFYSDLIGLIVITVILIALALVVLIITTLTQIRKGLTPLQQLDSAGEALKQGNLSYKIEYAGDNEIGRVCDSMREAFANLENVIGEISTEMKALSEGDLTYMPTQEYIGDFNEIRTSYLSLLDGLNAGFRKIKLSAAQITDGADQVSQGAQSLSQSSTEQAASLEELSATIGDIAAKINLNARSAEETNKLSDQIGDAIEISNTHMSDLMNAMERMTEASSEVNKIIKTIDDIAFQTNILALNAAVEAARAGEAGKGFAVVADEVRNLASKSAEAAKSTTELIETSIGAVAEGKDIAEKTAESLELVVQNANTITEKIKEILTSSEEQAVSASQINLGADQISSAVQTNSATSEESAAASEELAGQANILDTLIAQYKLMDDDTAKSRTSYAMAPKPEKTVEKLDTKPAAKVDIKVPEKMSAKPLQKKADKPIEKTAAKTLGKVQDKSEVRHVGANKAKDNGTDKTVEILDYENKMHDISQVKELHSAGAAKSASKPTSQASSFANEARATAGVGEISDFDNKYV